jgi:DNA topoisomerase VI subunit B
MSAPKVTLQRATFVTSRQLEFTSAKELQVQTGQPEPAWPLVFLKEASDNALDACEEAKVNPTLTITIDSKKGALTVRDNGPGIPAATIKSILDFNTRTSSREAYVSPTRGAQGNALKTVLAMPFAISHQDAITIIEAQGVRHTITLSVDAVRQQPVIDHQTQPIDKTAGTSITTRWPKSASSKWPGRKVEFLQFLSGYHMFNPNVGMNVSFDDDPRITARPNDAQWTKWRPSDPTSPHWYDQARFERLLAAYAKDHGDRTVREFITEFRGLQGSAKGADILDQVGLARVTIGDLFDAGGKPRAQKIARLLAAMQDASRMVKPAELGVIGEEHFRKCFAAHGGNLATFAYKRLLTVDSDIPVVIEAAFAYAHDCQRRILFTGVNFSPAIVNPFRQLGPTGEGLERVLAGQRVESTDPVLVAVHFTSPVIDYLDRGKSSIALAGSGTADEPEEQEDPDYYLGEVEPMNYGLATQLIEAVKAVTKRWLKQRKAEERNRAAFRNRAEALSRSRRVTQTTAAFEVMDRAFHDASGGQTFANARQIMYAARGEIQKRTNDKQLKDSYFTQTLLPDYIRQFNPPWKDRIAYDDRGHFVEPHTGKAIGVGTIAVREYLSEMCEPKPQQGFTTRIETHGPSGRFAGVFFVEKEGFSAIFNEAQIAKRFDLAFMSCKGISVTAARELADMMCAKYDIPLYLLTDFDKSGMSGAGTFERNNRRYTFRNKIKVVRIGLRLADVRAIAARRGTSLDDFTEKVFDKGSEDARFKNLKRNGATDDEANFLLTKRVELNALHTDELIDFVERKLTALGVRKIVPVRSALDDTYRMFKRGEHIQQLIDAELAKPNDVRVPKDLKQRVLAYLQEHPEAPWDAAVARIVKGEQQ